MDEAEIDIDDYIQKDAQPEIVVDIRPMAFPTEDEAGTKGSVIFPFGVQVFAEHQNADLIVIEGFDVLYYSEGMWRMVEDDSPAPSSVVNLRGNKPSIPEGPHKPTE